MIEKQQRSLILISSGGRLGLIEPDGNGERYLDLDVPGQVSWGAGPMFSDGRRIILSSYEEGKVWEGNVRTHLWIYDLLYHTLNEIATILNSSVATMHRRYQTALSQLKKHFEVPCAIKNDFPTNL